MQLSPQPQYHQPNMTSPHLFTVSPMPPGMVRLSDGRTFTQNQINQAQRQQLVTNAYRRHAPPQEREMLQTIFLNRGATTKEQTALLNRIHQQGAKLTPAELEELRVEQERLAPMTGNSPMTDAQREAIRKDRLQRAQFARMSSQQTGDMQPTQQHRSIAAGEERVLVEAIQQQGGLITNEQKNRMLQLRQQRLLAQQNVKMVASPLVPPPSPAHQTGFRNGQWSTTNTHSPSFGSPTFMPDMPCMISPSQAHMRAQQQDNSISGNERSPQFMAQSQQSNTYQSNFESTGRFLKAPHGQQAAPASRSPRYTSSLDPTLQTTPALPSSTPPWLQQAGQEARQPIPVTRLSSTPNLSQLLGAQHSMSSRQTEFSAPALPKKESFATAPAARPSSVQSTTATKNQNKQGSNTKPRDRRLSMEAMKHGVHNIDMSEQKFNANVEADELHHPGHATAATPGYNKEMMEARTRVATQQRKVSKEELAKKQATGGKVSMGAPSRPLPSSSTKNSAKSRSVVYLNNIQDVDALKRKREVVDLTGEVENQTRKKRKTLAHLNLSHAGQAAARSIATSLDVQSGSRGGPSSSRPLYCPRSAFRAEQLNARAQLRGVQMTDIEIGLNTYDAMSAWSVHHADLAVTQCKLNPPPSAKSDLPSSSFGPSNPLVRIDEHVQGARQKVRASGYSFGFSETNGGFIPQASIDAKLLCTADEDGWSRAPDETEMSEEAAKVQWEFWMLDYDKING